jgi:hypothetical protein
MLKRILFIGGGAGFLLALVLQIIHDNHHIDYPLAYKILAFYFLALTFIALPLVFRLLLERSTWIRILQFLRNIPDQARKVSYFNMLLSIVMCSLFAWIFWKSFAPNSESRGSLASFALVCVIVAFTVCALWVVPKLQVRNLYDRIDELEVVKLENEYRRTMAQILSTVFFVGTLYFTWRQLVSTDEGKLTDRFSKAVDLLASTERTARIGGVYALERISRDSPRDYRSVLEILSTFVRQSVPRAPGFVQTADPTTNVFEPLSHKFTDIQASLTVISRREKDILYERSRIFLNDCDLRNSVLVDGKLQGFVFDHSDLSQAVLLRAHLQGAILEGTVLRYAHLEDADFEEASLYGADLSGADLSGAKLDGCDLRGAILEKNIGLDKIASAYLANIAEIKASKEVIQMLSDKQAVVQPDIKVWQAAKRDKIHFRSLYALDRSD